MIMAITTLMMAEIIWTKMTIWTMVQRIEPFFRIYSMEINYFVGIFGIKKTLLEKSLFLWYEYKDLNSHEVDSWLFAVSVS